MANGDLLPRFSDLYPEAGRALRGIGDQTIPRGHPLLLDIAAQQRGPSLGNRARDLRPALSFGLPTAPLSGAMMGELARIAASRGPIDPELQDAIAAVPEIQLIRESWALAEELEQTRADIAIARAGADAIRTPSTLRSGLTGAAEGAAVGASVGGSIGAGVGAGVGFAGGVLGGEEGKRTKRALQARATKAERAIGPFEVGQQLAGLAPGVREQVLASGAGSTEQQQIQAALSRSGLRDSALGTLTGVAAAAVPEQAARGGTLGSGLTAIRRRVETILGSPVRPGRDRTAEALGALAEGFLTFRSLFPGTGGQQPTTGDRLIDQPLIQPGTFTPLEEPLFTPAR